MTLAIAIVLGLSGCAKFSALLRDFASAIDNYSKYDEFGVVKGGSIHRGGADDGCRAISAKDYIDNKSGTFRQAEYVEDCVALNVDCNKVDLENARAFCVAKSNNKK